MCFSEFIGYTCGHSSAEVLRPCPMTTQFYTNPLCTRYARRPILVPEMCPTCQRVLHGRAVLIVEWEHRWMHERGACGCEVRFPDLFRPRVVGRSQPVQSREAGIDAGNSVSEGEASTALPRMGSNEPGAKKVPALYQETVPITMAGDSKKPEVAVRIPSFYGAEWVDEHRQLHLNGSCKCPGSFSFYQTPANYLDDPSISHRSHEQVVQMADSQLPRSQSFQHGISSAIASQQRFCNPRNSRQGSFDCSQHGQVIDVRRGQSLRQAFSSQVHANQTQQPRTSFGSQESMPDRHLLNQPSQDPRNLTRLPLPQRSPGAIYEVDPAKSTNQLYNFACDEGAKIIGCADFQSVDFPQPKGVLPFVGLPIGAGPEGPASLPHTEEFAGCVLHDQELLSAARDKSHLPRYKSKSISCLHELKVTREHCSPASYSQGASSNVEADDDSEDGLSDDDQL